ncbi:MAG: hypothetical protein ACE5PV_09030 [Candidatus Poribacteria bacterium]
MIITLELPLEIEVQLRESTVRGDIDAVRRLLVEVLTPTVETFMHEPTTELTDAEFEAIANQLADELIACTGPNPPLLSDYAVSREGIYEVHR